MRAPLSWLRDYAPLDATVARLTEVLSELGLVVDAVEEVGAGLDHIVVARILEIRKHPNADRIRLVDVDAGDGGPLQIACGAWNFEVGDLVPLAPVGAVLPGDFTISRQKMRGEWSNGMLCSARELQLPEPDGSSDGLMILPPGLAAAGTPLTEALGIQRDVVFDLDITPNRPDALCMAGVARDLAAALGERWEWPSMPPAPAITGDLGAARIEVESGDLCPRFTGTILEGVPDGPSPAWMASRLTLAGMRPINAVVDISNYVMLDMGQPNHPYDLERLGGHGLLIRRGRAGEKLETLDGVERTLQETDCVICDAEGTPVGVGGIMGGVTAEIAAGTRRVLLESAWFSPEAIARTGKRLGLSSEARTRFERGVDPDITRRAVERFVALAASLPGGEGIRRGPTSDVRDEVHLPRAPKLTLRTSRVNEILGTELHDADVERLLVPIGFAMEKTTEGSHQVTVPTWRLECSREIDLIEEVARMWGYPRIQRTIPAGSRRQSGSLSARQKERRRVRQVLAGAGFYEAWTTTFLAPGDLDRAGLDVDAVEVENPLDRSESILRTSLRPGLLKALRLNLDRQADDLAFFEIGRVFAPPSGPGPTPDESEHLGVVILPARSANRPGDAQEAVAAAVRTWSWLREALRLDGADLQAIEIPGLHPTRAARITAANPTTAASPTAASYPTTAARPTAAASPTTTAGPTTAAPLGEIGEISPEVTAAYGIPGRVGWLSLSLDAVAAQPRRPRLARDVSRYPASDVDLAFVVDESVPAAELARVLEAAGGDVVEHLTLFDVYRGERLGPGRRSLAFRVRFRAIDHTLGDAELADLRRRLIEGAAATGAELRA